MWRKIMNKLTTKFLVCSLLISIFITSCYETKEYQFNIVNLTDIEEIVMEFNINHGRVFKRKKINFKDQNKITLRKEDFFIGYTIWGGCDVFFYPSIFGLENGGTVEAFIYDRPMVEKEGKTYKITPCENVNGYFLYFIKEGEIIRIISENPVINIEELDNSNIDLFYIKDPPKMFMDELIDKEFSGGYAVKNSIDNSLLMLR